MSNNENQEKIVKIYKKLNSKSLRQDQNKSNEKLKIKVKRHILNLENKYYNNEE